MLTLLLDRAGEADGPPERASVILGIHGNLGRPTTELIADVPAALQAPMPWIPVRV